MVIQTRAISKYYSLIIWYLPWLLFKEMQTITRISVSLKLENPKKKNSKKLIQSNVSKDKVNSLINY